MLPQPASEGVASSDSGLHSAPSGRARRWLGRLFIMVQVALVLLPGVLAYQHAKRNRVNVLHLDDWAYVPLYEKAVGGTLSAHDFFGGYLEHRPAVARLIAVATTLATKGDVRAQPIVAFIAIALTWIGCGLLLRRALGAWRRWWPAWGLLGWVLFNPVQWQEFLWPSCHMDPLPFLLLASLLLVLGHERWPLLLRAALCSIFAWTATYSFAAGLTLWVLVPLAVIWGYGCPTGRPRLGQQRGGWLAEQPLRVLRHSLPRGAHRGDRGRTAVPPGSRLRHR